MAATKTRFLRVQLSDEEALLLSRLCATTGLNKSTIVRRAVRQLALGMEAESDQGLYGLGAARFGLYGDATRQAADIKRFVRARSIRQPRARSE